MKEKGESRASQTPYSPSPFAVRNLHELSSQMKKHFLLYPLSFLLLLLGCAGPRTTLMQKVRGEMYASRADAAYQTYKKKVKDTQRVDELLNLGLLAFEAKDYAECQRALARADELAEERLTKSLSREAAGVAVSDRVRAYQGTVFDKAMIHYYRSLAYVAENKSEEAVVEGRRVASYLDVNARESKHTYKDDAFLQWFNGALYDHAGQVNDAWISYKRARELYTNHYGLPEPTYLAPATLAAARVVGDTTQERELDSLCFGTELNPEYGRVIVICETGIAPPIRESNVVLPILESVPSHFDNDDERDHYYYDMYERHRENPYYEQTRLKYLLRVALPFYEDGYAQTAVTRVSVKDESNECHCAELSEDVGAILRRDLKDRYPSIVARAITRAIIKYGATEVARELGKKKDEKGKRKEGILSDILGTVVNAAGAASEAADTRSWETLPDKIYVSDFQLPPGAHEIRALCEDDFGNTVRRHDFGTVDVKKGEVVFLRARCMN
jgi:uncharacterized protein